MCCRNINRYTLGSGTRLEIDVNVFNGAEDAFEAILFLQLPKEVDFVNIERSDSSESSVLCSPPTDETGYVLRCDLGNPLPAYKKAVFRILLQPNAVQARENAAVAAAAGKFCPQKSTIFVKISKKFWEFFRRKSQEFTGFLPGSQQHQSGRSGTDERQQIGHLVTYPSGDGPLHSRVISII